MSRNWISGNPSAGINLAAAVHADATAGDVTHLTADPANGLFGYLISERGTDVSGGPNVVGVGEDEAAVRLLPTNAVVELIVADGPSEGDAVYSLVDTGKVVYTVDEDDGMHQIGHVVSVPGRTPTTGTVFVYLGSCTGREGTAKTPPGNGGGD